MIRLSPADQLRTALIGPRSRKLRTALSALGIAVGIAALTAISGISASNQQQLLAELDDLGANLIVVKPGIGPDQKEVPLPETAPYAMKLTLTGQQTGVKLDITELKIGDGIHVRDLPLPAGSNLIDIKPPRSIGAKLGRMFGRGKR